MELTAKAVSEKGKLFARVRPSTLVFGARRTRLSRKGLPVATIRAAGNVWDCWVRLEHARSSFTKVMRSQRFRCNSMGLTLSRCIQFFYPVAFHTLFFSFRSPV